MRHIWKIILVFIYFIDSGLARRGRDDSSFSITKRTRSRYPIKERAGNNDTCESFDDIPDSDHSYASKYNDRCAIACIIDTGHSVSHPIQEGKRCSSLRYKHCSHGRCLWSHLEEPQFQWEFLQFRIHTAPKCRRTKWDRVVLKISLKLPAEVIEDRHDVMKCQLSPVQKLSNYVVRFNRTCETLPLKDDDEILFELYDVANSSADELTGLYGNASIQVSDLTRRNNHRLNIPIQGETSGCEISNDSNLSDAAISFFLSGGKYETDEIPTTTPPTTKAPVKPRLTTVDPFDDDERINRKL